MTKWTHVVEMKFELELMDGTRIGGAGGGLEIGGVDANLGAIRDPVTGEPYLPGSSIKGKLRSILEREHGLGNNGEPCGCGSPTCPVCPIFGAHKNTHAGSSRIIVRDAHFSAEYAKQWRVNPTFEEKTENIIDRRTGAASHPRTQERIPPGARFDCSIVLKIFAGDNVEILKRNIKNALAILERFDALGAGGSRGSGRIAIRCFSDTTTALAEVTL